MHLAKEAQIEANKRRPVAISERTLYQGKSNVGVDGPAHATHNIG